MTRSGLSRRGLLGGAVALATPGLVRAQSSATLEIANPFGPAHPIADVVVPEFSEIVSQATDGRVQFAVRETPAGPPPAQYELLQAGDLDATYTLHGYSGPDAFVRAQLGQFSQLGDSFSVTYAFATTYMNLLDARDEHAGVELLAVFQHGPGQIFLRNRSIRTAEDFQGLRIRTSGGYIAELMRSLGAEPVAMSPVVVADAMAAGEIDAVAFPFEGSYSFGLSCNVTEVHTLPGGYYNASFFLAASTQAWSRLSPEDQTVVRELAATYVPELVAKAMEFYDILGEEEIRALDVPIVEAEPELVKAVVDIGSAYEQRWAERLAQNGYDGPAALARVRGRTGVL